MNDYKQFRIHMILSGKDIRLTAEVMQANGVSLAKVFLWNLRYNMGM